MNPRVLDPFGVAADPAMPSLAAALDPVAAQRRLGRILGRHIELKAIRVARYKPGRRCLIEYDVELAPPKSLPEILTLIGKVRAKRYGKSGHRLLAAFWNAGFDTRSTDGISVPEPIGMVFKFRMWLQRKMPGQVATELLTRPSAVELMRRIAEAAHKVHRAAVPPDRRHTIADELHILRERLTIVSRSKPQWEPRIESVLAACERLGASVPDPVFCGIHRDFYSDQILVDGARLYLTDFDLYCEADPGLDIGNFLGHLTEYSLRVRGDPEALVSLEEALEERFVQLSGPAVRKSVRAYATLTLVRHIYLSTLFPERRASTADLLEICEQRLGVTVGVFA